MIKVRIFNGDKNNHLEYATEGSAGIDLKYSGVHPIVLNCGDTKLIPTGVFIELPEGYEAQVRPRSGLALKHSITVLNTPGTIDSDYRGEIGVILINHHKENGVIINPGDRIAQLVFNKYEKVEFEEVELNDLTKTKRGSGGYGHTGV